MCVNECVCVFVHYCTCSVGIVCMRMYLSPRVFVTMCMSSRMFDFELYVYICLCCIISSVPV